MLGPIKIPKLLDFFESVPPIHSLKVMKEEMANRGCMKGYEDGGLDFVPCWRYSFK